ncbi:MAG TPA: alpha-galactosidase, partial [Anaerohalosphaeraceae bacterium]|nr:alpha-galactosidase [Anaerohalosphaeraceae bacterium]
QRLFSADPASVGAAYPFSFGYGGKISSEFLGNWEKNVEDKTLDSTKQQRILTLTDPQTGLEVKAVVTIYTDTAGGDWTIYFTNTSDQDTPVIEAVKPLDVSMTAGPDVIPVLHRINGSHDGVDDWMNYDVILSPGNASDFSTIEGRTSMKDGPFFNLDCGSSGVITAIGWSGQWMAKVENSKEGSIRMQAGMQYIHTILHPGETIRTPRILQLYWFGQDELRSYNLFRQTMLAHIVPKINGQTAVPPIAHLSTSFYELNYSTEEYVLSHLESIQGLGFEYFWLDAYYTKGGFPAGMGNYGLPIEEIIPDPERFPRGIKSIADAVTNQGYQFLLWFEPERVAGGTYIAQNHPEFVISPGNDGSGLVDLGNPQAREYMTAVLLAAIKEYRLGCMRFDYNLNPLPYWQFENQKDPNRVGICEIRYMEGLYRMWDDLRQAYPHLLIDDTASGGNRIDLETMSRALPLWRTDWVIFPLLG